jgi:hypothetical protein
VIALDRTSALRRRRPGAALKTDDALPPELAAQARVMGAS